jgi:hypothetical protein
MRKLIILAALVAVSTASAAFAQPPAGQQGPAAPSDPGKLILFEALNYGGDMVEIDNPRTRVRTPWNIRSVAIHPGERWQICAQPRFQAPCIILDRSVNDANLIGVSGQIGSARPAPADAHN